ncbi:SDR family oxidoreductase [Pseudactinotalea sp. HY158]|uniref:SDR family oxidoreductase n=1 Tax=Pseudactinotalea sp. HY158 TaxID=2654547 RepID=UPI00129C2B39|nr:SDR family oxidoreductase [Pseudactinotalea sp. HY158]QGH69714.1 SDR family oxidoreductase [Pseudactinotalea sp. HY158]
MNPSPARSHGADFSLAGQVGLVTGAASGIGQAIAWAMAAAGADVACLDRDGDSLAATVEGIRGLGRTALPLECDVTSEDALGAAVATVESDLGELSLAVNSAGIANAAPAENLPREQWQRLYDVNVTGVFLSCQAQARVMLPRRRGAIVNVASMSGTIANRGLTQVHYNSAKAAVAHLTKSLAVEWADRGIRVNAISPGYTATPMNRRPEVADQARRFAADTPLARMAEPSEIAGPTVFLLSSAASFCTGVDLLVDGGFCCW